VERAEKPLREFMFKQTRERDLALFVKLAKLDRPKTRADVPTYVLVPAFIISELKTAFQIGFLIFLPFLVIDLVVSSTLMSLGMMMLPPVFISLPFKILLFVLVDGWNLVTQSLVQSFG
jgi:flagellar biosynthetic protein FliP